MRNTWNECRKLATVSDAWYFGLTKPLVKEDKCVGVDCHVNDEKAGFEGEKMSVLAECFLTRVGVPAWKLGRLRKRDCDMPGKRDPKGFITGGNNAVALYKRVGQKLPYAFREIPVGKCTNPGCKNHLAGVTYTYRGCVRNKAMDYVGKKTSWTECQALAKKKNVAFFGMEYPQGAPRNKASCLLQRPGVEPWKFGRLIDKDCSDRNDSSGHKMGGAWSVAIYAGMHNAMPSSFKKMPVGHCIKRHCQDHLAGRAAGRAHSHAHREKYSYHGKDWCETFHTCVKGDKRNFWAWVKKQGYKRYKGACATSAGKYGRRHQYWNGKYSFASCKKKCDSMGARCAGITMPMSIKKKEEASAMMETAKSKHHYGYHHKPAGLKNHKSAPSMYAGEAAQAKEALKELGMNGSMP